MSFCKTNNRKLGNFVLIGLIFLFMFTQCQPFDLTPVPKYSYSLEAAQIVSHVTSGLLPTNEKIRVRFTEPVSDALEYGQKIENRYITFSPGIDGDLSWEDSQTLVFTPREALPKRRVYEGIVKVSMFNQFKSSGVSEVKFGFKTEGREIEKIDGDFEFQIQDDPKNLFYRTTVLFTTPVAEEQVREAVKLSCNGKDLKLDISQGSEGREYHISSEVFRRTDERKRLELRVSANPVDISHDYRHEFFLEPVSCFTVTNISVIEQRHTPVIQVSFSDDIDPFQDLNGLVTLAPYRDIKYKVYGSKVYLTGDFAYGENYQIKFSPNIRSRQNNRTSKEFLTNVEIATVKPQMAFLNDGVFLPSGNKYRLRFQTINIRKVHIEVIKVFENNLGQFLQTEQLHSEKSRTYSFNSEYVNRVGVIAANQDLPIGDTKNEWLSHDLDLSKLIKPGEKGLFLIQLSMEREDMIWDQDSSRDQYSYYGDDYYSNPSSNGYLYSHGHIYKPVTVSDIGLTYKQAGATHFIYATDIMSSTPLQGVKVGLRTYQNQLVGQGETDREGRVELRNIKDSVFYVEAERAGQRSMIKLNEMGWNLTTFDIEGYEEPEIGTRAFMFTERGVYRPGDEINLSCIFRNQDSSFPKNHPVTLEFFNPRNQSVYKSTNREGMDGFYNFNFSTKQEDPTGNWKVKVIAGSREFFHTIKVETVVPYRLKVFITSKKDRISITDNSLELNLDSIYLFGNAASNLTAEANITLRNVQKTFPKFKNYTFTNQTVEATDRKTNIFSGNLDEKGHADISWDIPDLSKAPSALEAVIHAKVYERGGRPAEKIEVFPVDPYTHYVGIETPDFDYGYARIGMPLRLNTVCVTASGEPAKGRELEYTLYRNERYWWWEYDDYSQFRYRYKTDTSTQVIKQGRFTSGLTPVAISIQPETWGEYLIEVRDTSDKNGHVAGFFFYASSWGRATPGSKEAATLVLKTDKPSYTVGQVATIKFPRPTEGAVLVSIERGASILKSYWIKLNQSTREDETLTVQITKDMVPTAYVSVSIIQPHAQTVNDRPIRMYGVATLNVKDPATVSSMEIKTSAEFKPSAPFIVEVQTQDRKESQFVIAVVDEGLLDITNFKTPDPWEFFFHKQRLAVMTYDLFSEVIGAQKGDPFKVFSVGGGGEMYDQGMIGAQGKEVRRFKPVSLFKGPITTNATGYAKVSFDMPNYVGSVRIMVIAVKNGQYSSSEKTVPVKTKLMVMPTLPRVLGPDEEFKVPVTVFLMQDNTERVITSIHVEGPIEVVGSMYSDLGVMPKGEKDVMFTLRTKSAAGPVKIKIRAVAGGISTEEETEILIRATSPRAYNSITKRGTPGTQVDFTLPQDGLPGTMEAKINVMRHEFLDFGPRFDWLIHYPYGCIEQTTSSVFPQLYLKKIFTLDPGKVRTIDGNINA
ncbi:MAG: hypothetical protein EHM28_06010 [Spirochaetaceae bacterium]|nr:MAG: hypothetical protein EHM28_06010 [Spirochaetaceae bacterium]